MNRYEQLAHDLAEPMRLEGYGATAKQMAHDIASAIQRAVEEAVAEEREACAKQADARSDSRRVDMDKLVGDLFQYTYGAHMEADYIAHAIRERSKKEGV